MRAAVLLLAALLIVCGQAWAQDPAGGKYQDGATSAWFKGLSSPWVNNCCDQADCARTESDYRIGPAGFDAATGERTPGKGQWWALSKRTGKWVPIPDETITRDASGKEVVSIFKDAVLCE